MKILFQLPEPPLGCCLGSSTFHILCLFPVDLGSVTKLLRVVALARELTFLIILFQFTPQP